jgi:MoaA/NifB/PqqE/SkfB family radical SAM enzyme
MENFGTRKLLRNKVHEILGNDDSPQDCFYKYAMVWMSRKCNSKCKYCYQEGDFENTAWSYEKADRVTSLLLDQGYHVQPLINEWLPEFWDFLKIMKKCNWKEITTNGLIILSSYKEFFPLLHENGITDIRHSLFPKGIHEEITGRERNKTIRAIELSKKHGFRVVVNYVVTTETLPHILEVCNELADMNVDEVQFMNLIYLGRAKEMQKQLLTEQHLKTFWDTWKQLTEDKKYENIEFDFQANFGPCPHGDHVSKGAAKKDNFCIAGMNKCGHFLYVTPENGIYPCFLLSEPQFKIGEIVEKNGDYSLEYHNTNDWEKQITPFTRANCAATQFIMKNVLQRA